jgi:hypothetical protein
MENQEMLKSLIDDGIYELDKGRGSLRYYKYWSSGLKLTTKTAIEKAIKLNLTVIRKDKITGKSEIFNYKTNKFEAILKQ